MNKRGFTRDTFNLVSRSQLLSRGDFSRVIAIENTLTKITETARNSRLAALPVSEQAVQVFPLINTVNGTGESVQQHAPCE